MYLVLEQEDLFQNNKYLDKFYIILYTFYICLLYKMHNEERIITDIKYKLFSFASETHELSIQVLSTTLIFCLLLFNDKLIKIIDKRYIIFISSFLIIAGIVIIITGSYEFINFINIEKLSLNNFRFPLFCFLIILLIYLVFAVIFYKISKNRTF